MIYGANVFNHVDDINDFFKAARRLIKKNGQLILEVPDLNSLIKRLDLIQFTMNTVTISVKVQSLNY